MSGGVLVPAIMTTIVAPLVAWALARRQNRAQAGHVDAQAAAVIQQSALDLLAPLREQVAGLTTEVTTLRAKVHTLSDELDRERRDRARAEAVLERHGLTID